MSTPFHSSADSSAAALVSASATSLSARSPALPGIVHRAGPAAIFAAEEFFYGAIRNQHTRLAYRRAVDQFLIWCEGRELELIRIAPKDVGQYFDALREKGLGIATRKQQLAAIRHFFDGMVTRHAIILNPALSVREERYEVVEGKTPEITIEEARHLLKGISVVTKNRDGSERPCLTGLRDRAILATLAYTACRASAVSKLKRGGFYHAGHHQTSDGQTSKHQISKQWMLHFDEKGGKSREIPARHDLEQMIAAYLEAAGLWDAPKNAPLFRAAHPRTGKLKDTAIHVNDICRMMKRRLRATSLPSRLSPHSFRVTTITDLLTQGVPLEDVQHLAGHADPRTTRLYDRRQKKVTRNIVERISI